MSMLQWKQQWSLNSDRDESHALASGCTVTDEPLARLLRRRWDEVMKPL
jgi:hypothetical protein